MLRLALNIILFLFSLLCVFVAPTFQLWMAAILASEFSWLFFMIATGLMIWAIFGKRFRKANLMFSAISMFFFAVPMFMAWEIGQKLPAELSANLGGQLVAPEGGNVFHLQNMFRKTQLLPYERISYSNKDNIDLTLDFYQSQQTGTRPCVIVIHGGSWSSGDSQQVPELNSVLAQRGYQVASVNYRLAPKYISPAPIEDIGDAIKYLKQHSRELKIDTTNFILLGRSAGAQLALVAAYTLLTDNIRGVINFYGPSDMIWGYSKPSNKWIMDAQQVMENFLGGTYSKVPQNYMASSPVEVISRSKRNIPVLTIHGMNDALVAYEHSEHLERRLTQRNIPHYLLSLPWATHGCDYTLNGPSGQLTTYAVEYFTKQVIKQREVDIQLTTAESADTTQKPGMLAAF